MPDDDLVLSSPNIEDDAESGEEALESEGQDSQDTGSQRQDADTSEDQSDDGLISIKRSDFSGEIRRLVQDEPEFAQAFNSHVGQKARLRYQPRIDERDVQIQALREGAQSDAIRGMRPEDIQKKFAEDPDFARQYTNSVHPESSSAEGMADGARGRAAFSTLLADALDAGLTAEQVQAIEKKATDGGYANDADGQVLTHWSEQLPLVSQDITAQVRGNIQPNTKSTNKNTASPDVSGGSSRRSGSAKWTKAQVDAMTPAEVLEAFPGENDFENAVRTGQISGYSDEALELYQP